MNFFVQIGRKRHEMVFHDLQSPKKSIIITVVPHNYQIKLTVI